MNINESTIKGKWLEVKGEVQKAWGKITDDELEQTKGDMKAIGGLIEQKYGAKKSEFNDKLSGIFKTYDQHKDAAVDKAKDSLKH